MGAGQTMQSNKGRFFTTLQREYKRLAKLEMNEADWFDAAMIQTRSFGETYVSRKG